MISKDNNVTLIPHKINLLQYNLFAGFPFNVFLIYYFELICFTKVFEVIPGFDLTAGSTWIYPTNKSYRQYQFDIVKSCLYDNTLVCLPTGLGKKITYFYIYLVRFELIGFYFFDFCTYHWSSI